MCQPGQVLEKKRPGNFRRDNEQPVLTLEETGERSAAEARKGGRLASRYALQALRAMMTLQDYPGMDSLWLEAGPGMEDGVIKDMCLGYMARADFEMGRIDKAMSIYSSQGDLSSIALCLKRLGRSYTDWDLIGSVARYCPDNAALPGMMQRWFIGKVQNSYSDKPYSERMKERLITPEEADRICRICDAAAADPACSNPATWLYVKALALDMSARSKEAYPVCLEACTADGTEFIRSSARVLSIYLDAKVSRYDEAYEARLLRDLRWLDRKIADNITDEVCERTKGDCWELMHNMIYYYWNDMLKKTLLGEVCPRMIDRGKGVLAIRLANMADNSLLNRIYVYEYWGKKRSPLSLKEYRASTSLFNDLDYSNGLFGLLNSEVEIADIEAYAASLGKPGTALESFLDDRSYTEEAYFLDVAGTRLLRDKQYRDAVRVLEKVPAAYQHRLNTCIYMDRDPFLPGFNESGVPYRNYKLNFARRMAECVRVMGSGSGADEKGQAYVSYGLGLKSSCSFAWALTDYRQTARLDSDDSQARTIQTELGDKYIKEGLAMIEDREIKARELLRLQLRLSVVQDFNGTAACEYVLRHCDEYRDYLAPPDRHLETIPDTCSFNRFSYD